MSIETADPDDEQTSDPLLSMTDVSVEYEPGGLIRRFLRDETVQAVDGVSLDIEENDVLAVVGESGCGKTTLGKSAIGVQRPTGGTVRYRGQDIWAAKDREPDVDVEWEEIRRKLQIIHQDPSSALNSNRTVLSSLADPLKRWRSDLGPREREENIYRILEFLGLQPPQDYASRYPYQLSGGEQQRVALGRALLMSPDLILADEAVSALDVSLRVEMMDLMLDIQDRFGTSYIFISHDIANARYLAKKAGGRIAIMYLGQIVEISDPDDLVNNPKHPYSQVLRWATPPLEPEAAEAGTAADPPVRTVDVPDPVNPPSGCNFHTRCPKAREVCTQEEPGLIEGEDGIPAACFRQDSTHEYWNSPSIDDES